MLLARRLVLPAFALLLFAGGCAITEGESGLLPTQNGNDRDEALPEVGEVWFEHDVLAHLQLGDGEAPAEGLIVAPEEIEVFVGDELELDLVLSDPSVGDILPGQLPEDSIFEDQDFGARVRWMPTLDDVGQHDFVFLVVDPEDANLILGQTNVLVSVLPRFSLIEYGF